MTRLYRKRSWQAPGRAGSIPETELVVWTVITLGVTVSFELRLCVTVCLINSDRVWWPSVLCCIAIAGVAVGVWGADFCTLFGRSARLTVIVPS